MNHSKEIPWLEPLEFTSKIIDNYQIYHSYDNFAFLHSSLASSTENLISYLALFSKEKLITNDFNHAKSIITNSNEKWFGYIGYEVARQFENFHETNQSLIEMDLIHFEQFHLVLEFDHLQRKIFVNFDDQKYLNLVLNYFCNQFSNPQIPSINQLESNFSDQQFIEAIEKLRTAIANGDLFQANITRKFYGNFNQTINLPQAFKILIEHQNFSKTNYYALLKFDQLFTICASPELFCNLANKKIISTPIKGTAKRSNNSLEDQMIKNQLQNSSKEQAENLMIVDLVRNDLSRVCEIGSVKVEELFKVSTYQNIHHLSSQISGKLLDNLNNFDALLALFPAGSMTGAPKVKAMDLIAKLEKLNRGIYSGAIGLIEGDNFLNLAVVIRTLIIQNQRFEMQFGSGITYNSIAKNELEESYQKARTWFEVLKLNFKF